MSNSQARPMKGRGVVMGPKPKIEKGTLKRVLSYISKNYKMKFVLVVICIIISSITNVLGILSLKTIIDEYITPLIGQEVVDYSGLASFSVIVAGIFFIGIIASFVYNRLMAGIAQGVLRDIRDDMFTKMQKLPVKYFDTHTHGEIMSHYTNDTDTLRQMLAHSLPNIISSVITIVSTVFSMIFLSWQLSLFVFAFTFMTLYILKTIASKSSKFFISQQESLAKVNGYVE